MSRKLNPDNFTTGDLRDAERGTALERAAKWEHSRAEATERFGRQIDERIRQSDEILAALDEE